MHKSVFCSGVVESYVQNWKFSFFSWQYGRETPKSGPWVSGTKVASSIFFFSFEERNSSNNVCLCQQTVKKSLFKDISFECFDCFVCSDSFESFADRPSKPLGSRNLCGAPNFKLRNEIKATRGYGRFSIRGTGTVTGTESFSNQMTEL